MTTIKRQRRKKEGTYVNSMLMESLSVAAVATCSGVSVLTPDQLQINGHGHSQTVACVQYCMTKIENANMYICYKK